MKTARLVRLCSLLLALTGSLAFIASPALSQTTTPPTNAGPFVVIASPINGQVFPAPANVHILAHVVTGSNFVRFIGIYENSKQLAFFLLDPGPRNYDLTFDWTNVPAGTYTLTVAVTNTVGQYDISAPVTFFVASNPPIPIVTIVAPDPIAVEGTNFPWCPPPTALGAFCSGTNTATFLVRRFGDISNDLTVPYSVGGTAIPGTDYVPLPGSVTIPAGRRFALITVVPLDDIDPTTRRFDTVIVALTPPPPTANPLPPPYIVGWPGKAEAIILEDYDLPGPRTGMMKDNTFHIAWPGTNGSNYSVEVSTDLQTWLPVGTNVVMKGSIHFADPETGSYSNRYYRVVPAGPPVY